MVIYDLVTWVMGVHEAGLKSPVVYQDQTIPYFDVINYNGEPVECQALQEVRKGDS